jgi:hypothetical protein
MSKPYNPNTQGWGFALVVCALTAGLFGWAYSVHNANYVHPRDPMMQQVYAERDSVKRAGGEASHEGEEHADEKHEGEEKKADH